MNGTLKDVFGFVSLLQRFQQIKRAYYATDEDRAQNDAEHSFGLAMLAWYVVRLLKLEELDLSLILSYALVHDFIELVAGDTDPYNPMKVATKSVRENEARVWLIRELPEFTDLHHLLNEYEDGRTPEAQFVRALDKIIPVIEIAFDEGRSWKERGQTLEMLRAIKSPKVEHSPIVSGLYHELVLYLEQRRDELFSQGTQGTFDFMEGSGIRCIEPHRHT